MNTAANNNKLEVIVKELNTSVEKAADTAVIWLHGLGADGNDFVPIVPELGLAPNLAIRFIFPHAPMQAVTINNGYVMRAWYDIFSLDRSAPQDKAGIERNAALVLQLVEEQHAQGIPYERIFLAGFSQGCAMALHIALRLPHKLAGIIGLSGYLPLHEDFATERSEANIETPIFLAHGSMDPVVPFAFGQHSYEFLKAQGFKVSWHSYPMQHQVCMEEIVTIGGYIQDRLK